MTLLFESLLKVESYNKSKMKNNKKIVSIDNDYNGEDEPPKLKFEDVMLGGTNPTT